MTTPNVAGEDDPKQTGLARPSGKRKRWLPWIVAGATALILLCCGIVAVVVSAGDSDKEITRTPASSAVGPGTVTPPAAQPPATSAAAPTSAVAPAAPATPDTTFGDGTWLVPADIKPGTYHTTVPEDSTGCYWQRASSADGDFNSILANDNVQPGGHVIVTVGRSDKAFKANDCGEWSPAPRSGPRANEIGEGT